MTSDYSATEILLYKPSDNVENKAYITSGFHSQNLTAYLNGVEGIY